MSIAATGDKMDAAVPMRRNFGRLMPFLLSAYLWVTHCRRGGGAGDGGDVPGAHSLWAPLPLLTLVRTGTYASKGPFRAL
jgi:hypothetical protein